PWTPVRGHVLTGEYYSPPAMPGEKVCRHIPRAARGLIPGTPSVQARPEGRNEELQTEEGQQKKVKEFRRVPANPLPLSISYSCRALGCKASARHGRRANEVLSPIILASPHRG